MQRVQRRAAADQAALTGAISSLPPGDLAAAFDAAMAETGPYGPSPRLAVAVSGGADSLALALLADDWARRRDGSIIGLIVDHGLRANSGAEARLTVALLGARRIESRMIDLDLAGGPALQERARIARREALAQAAKRAGAVHLLLGHHWRDQAETAAMRAARGSRGLAGMAALVAHRDVVMLRPLLSVDPATLRNFLRARGCAWIEDPSNTEPRFERVRVRAVVEQDASISREAIRQAGIERCREMHDTARRLADCGGICPEGFVWWRGSAMPADALAAVLRVVGGHAYAPDRAAVSRLADRLRRATLGGVQVTRWRDVWLLAREPAACETPINVQPGQIWDGRFRLITAPDLHDLGALQVGALGARAAAFRKLSPLPSLILQSLPAVHDCKTIISVPHIGFGMHCKLVFDPPVPAAPLSFALHRFV